MTINEFFTKLENGATWSAGVSFKRANPLPIDLYSVFNSYEALVDYATNNAVAYPGQIVAVTATTEVEGVTTYTGAIEVYALAQTENGEDEEGNKLYKLVPQPIGRTYRLSVSEDDEHTLVLSDGVKDTEITLDFLTEGEVKAVIDESIQIIDLGGKKASEWNNDPVDLSDKRVHTIVFVGDVGENDTGEGYYPIAMGNLNLKVAGYQLVVENYTDKDVWIDQNGADSCVSAHSVAVYKLVHGVESEGTSTKWKLIDSHHSLTSADILSGISDFATEVDKRFNNIENDYLTSADKDELTQTVATAKQEAIDTILGEAIDEDFDTLREVAEWIKSDTTNSAKLIERVTAIEKDYLKGADKDEIQDVIDELEKFVGTLPEGATSTTVIAYIQETITALKINDYAKVSELTALANRVSTLEQKSAQWDEAEKNVIASVDTEQFNVDETRKLTLLDIAMSKVTGLEDALADKANKDDVYTKDEITDLIADITGGESAADVLASLNQYKTDNDARVGDIEDKLDKIEDGAQANVLEGIKVNGTLLEIADKTVNIGIASASALGVVKSSDAENKVAIDEDGIMEVNSLNVNKLVQTDGDTLILNGGNASLSTTTTNV